MATVVLLGTLDTKGPEYAFLRDRVLEAGCEVILVDAGVMSDPSPGDIGPNEVAAAAGEDRAALAAAHDRGPAMAAMTRGLSFSRMGLKRRKSEGTKSMLAYAGSCPRDS